VHLFDDKCLHSILKKKCVYGYILAYSRYCPILIIYFINNYPNILLTFYVSILVIKVLKMRYPFKNEYILIV
jgi:hypothetical protein